VISIVREFIGGGTFFGMKVLPSEYTIGFFLQSPGGFFVFGMLIAIGFALNRAIEKRSKAK
jgi:electron transport complex protein RnfE